MTAIERERADQVAEILMRDVIVNRDRSHRASG